MRTLVFCSALLLPACGGRAALEAYYLAGEGGGGGGSSSSSSTSSSSSSTSSSSSSTSSSSSSTSSSGGLCDGTGDCQLCVSCAVDGPCLAMVSACMSNPQCEQFNQCMDACSGDPCFQQCSSQFPAGAQPWLDAIQCVLCNVCTQDCQEPPQLCNM